MREQYDTRIKRKRKSIITRRKKVKEKKKPGEMRRKEKPEKD